MKALADALVLAFAAPLAASTFTVTNTNDSGAGSLRQALLDAQNCAGAPHTIAFDVPAGSLTNGVAVITPATALPPSPARAPRSTARRRPQTAAIPTT